MVTNVEAITIFNGRTDSQTRRKKYIPTVIQHVSYQEAKGATVTNNGVWSDDVQYKLRIPFHSPVQNARLYLPSLVYGKLDDEKAMSCWTISKGDLVLCGAYDGEKQMLFEDELTAYAKERGFDLIHVTEYADNTVGGSLYTKHWRIGGK